MKLLVLLGFVIGLRSSPCMADEAAESAEAAWSLGSVLDMASFFVKKASDQPKDSSVMDPWFLIRTLTDYKLAQGTRISETAVSTAKPKKALRTNGSRNSAAGTRASSVPGQRNGEGNGKSQKNKQETPFSASNFRSSGMGHPSTTKSRLPAQGKHVDAERTRDSNPIAIVDRYLGDPATRNVTVEFARLILARAKEIQPHAKQPHRKIPKQSKNSDKSRDPSRSHDSQKSRTSKDSQGPEKLQSLEKSNASEESHSSKEPRCSHDPTVPASKSCKQTKRVVPAEDPERAEQMNKLIETLAASASSIHNGTSGQKPTAKPAGLWNRYWRRN